VATQFDRSVQTEIVRLVAGLGETPPYGTESPREQVTQMAIDAMNDAIQYIYNRAQWDFRLHWAGLTLAEAQAYYQMPDDFSELAFEFQVYSGTRLLPYIDYRDFLQCNPDFRGYPVGSADQNLVVIQGFIAQKFELADTPTHFSITNDMILIWPPPNADWVLNNSLLMVPYYKMAPIDLHMNATEIPLPANLLNAMHFIALGYLKQYLEYPDFERDESRGERMLAQAINRRSKKRLADRRFLPRAV
jgi:hypothetical protein